MAIRIYHIAIVAMVPLAVVIAIFQTRAPWLLNIALINVLVLIGSYAWSKILKSRPLSSTDQLTKIGSITVSSGQIVLGEADLLANNPRVTSVPNGELTIYCSVREQEGIPYIMSFNIDVPAPWGGISCETVRASVDSGMFMIADMREYDMVPEVLKDQFRRDFREAVNKVAAQGKPPFIHQFVNAHKLPWGIVFAPGLGDGLYAVKITRSQNTVVRMECEFTT